MNSIINIIKDRYQLVVGLSIVIALMFGGGLSKLKFTTDFNVYFSPENPQMQVFDKLEADFNKQDSLTFLVVPKNNDIFTEDTIDLIRTLSEKSWQVPYSRRVDSLTNFLRTTSENDELETDELISSDVEITPELLQSVKQFILNDSIAKQFSSPNSNVGLINVSLTLPSGSLTANKEVVLYAREMLESISYDKNNIDVHILGTAMINYALEEAIEGDIAMLVPFSYALIFIVMFALLRVASGTLLTITVITLTNITVFGAIGWAGVTMTPAIGAVPSIITIIAVADCMHFLISYYHELSLGKEKRDAIGNALHINFSPMLVTSVTTAIGLLCLNFSESPPYQDLGNIVAFGAIVAFIFTVTFLPAILLWMPASTKKDSSNRHSSYFSSMATFGDWVIKHYKILMVSTLLFTFFASFSLMNNTLSDNWIDNYDDSYPIRQAINVQEDQMYGAHFIDFRIDSKQPQGINNPAYMKDLDKLTLWLSSLPKVGYVSSFSNQVKSINKILHNDDEAYFSIPKNRDLLSQSNLLYEMSLPFGMGLDEQIDIQKRSIRLRIILHEMTSSELLAFDSQVTRWATENTPNITLSEGSGLGMLFAHIMQRNVTSLIQGTFLALVLISLLMIWVLKSVKLGLLSLVPNIFPAVLAYGIWAVLDGRVDLSVSIVATMSLGLVVDDTVHFLSKYQLARNTKGLDVYQGILYSFRTVGVAMLITSIVLTLGFGILMFSHLRPSWAMGELLAITIMFALVVDFLLLPGLLIMFDKRNQNEPKTASATI